MEIILNEDEKKKYQEKKSYIIQNLKGNSFFLEEYKEILKCSFDEIGNSSFYTSHIKNLSGENSPVFCIVPSSKKDPVFVMDTIKDSKETYFSIMSYPNEIGIKELKVGLSIDNELIILFNWEAINWFIIGDRYNDSLIIYCKGCCPRKNAQE